MSGITETFTHKLGPLPAWAWVGIGAGVGFLYLRRKKPASSSGIPGASLGYGGGGLLGTGSGNGGNIGGGGGGTGTGTGSPPIATGGPIVGQGPIAGPGPPSVAPPSFPPAGMVNVDLAGERVLWTLEDITAVIGGQKPMPKGLLYAGVTGDPSGQIFHFKPPAVASWQPQAAAGSSSIGGVAGNLTPAVHGIVPQVPAQYAPRVLPTPAKQRQ